MKHAVTILSLFAALLLAACDEHGPSAAYDGVPPLPPVGIATVTGDNAVYLSWIDNQEHDIAGYNVYVAGSYDGRYDRIGSTRGASFTDAGARNGFTYYYAVTAFDADGNESDLSRDVAYDTPRPEGVGVTLADRNRDPQRAGYDFSAFRVLHYDTDATDLFFEASPTGVPFFVVWEDSDIQDMGYTRNFDEISAAPTAGWNPTRDAQIVAGHTYVIWTYDDHYAKVRVTSISPSAVTFDWGYQLVTGNTELAHRRGAARSRHAARGH
jgi:hypothetical protein